VIRDRRPAHRGDQHQACTGAEIDQLYGLEPVLEPGEMPGSDALERFVEFDCPYCAECIGVRVDLSAGSQCYIEDCQVCCAPITISVAVSEAGMLREVSAERLA
jgi:hypothetical protein